MSSFSRQDIVIEPLPVRATGLPTRDLTNQKIGRLTVVGYAGTRKHHALWWCECECGGVKQIYAKHLGPTGTRSCGCLVRQVVGERRRSHGHADHPLYSTWNLMKQRCENPDSLYYHRYGGRGIKVCEGWHDINNFLADMGNRPDGKTLDRIDNDGHYSCGKCSQCLCNQWTANCHWGAHKEQANNRHSNKLITFEGKTQSIAEWAQELQMPYSLLNQRLTRRKWSVVDALTTPRIMNGFTLTNRP